MKGKFWVMPIRVAICFGFGGLPSSYNDMGLLGLELAQEDFGILFDFDLPETERGIEDYIRDCASTHRYELILSMGFASGNPMRKVAAEYPKQKFAILDALVELPNVASYVSNQVEIGFYAGYVTALITNTKIVGSIWGADYPLMHRWIAGIVEGAKYSNPDVEVLHSFVGSWSDPITAEKLALAQYVAGADIVIAHSTEGDSGIVQAAKKMNKYVVGFGEARPQDPDHIVFDVVRHAEAAIYDAIKRVLCGTYLGNRTHVFGLKEGNWVLTLKDAHALVTDNIRSKGENLRSNIIAGRIALPNTSEEIAVSVAKSKKITLCARARLGKTFTLFLS